VSARTSLFGDEPWIIDAGATSHSSGEACGASQMQLLVHEPVLGTQSPIRVRNAVFGSGVALVFGAAAQRPRALIGDCLSYVDPATLMLLGGYGVQRQELRVDLDVPSDPALLDVRVAFQAWMLQGPGIPIESSNGAMTSIGR
jgi:hypothetical protein